MRDDRRSEPTKVRRARRDRGAALVEFAIVAPLLFSLLMGMMTGGIALSRKNSMTSAVREGARLGATLIEGPNWADDVRTRVINLAPEDLTTSQVCVQLIKRGTPDTVKRTSTGCSAAMLAIAPSISSVPANECVVRVWARRTAEMEWVFASTDLTLDARALSAYERECT